MFLIPMRLHPCLYLLLLTAGFCSPGAAAERVYDFRVVIDVSGSMKQTDPDNLRVPALKLVNGLIPTGSRAGVWTFGRYVDMSVKWGRVDDDWRKRADLGADRIHSNASFTNIESALARAAVGWDRPDPETKRVLLLLTDGKVDISRDPEKNRQSRDKIFGSSLAALKKAGAEVHAIALSQRSDEVLLKHLALETNGSFALARTAAELQKVFFRMFERAARPDTVAFDGREFPIDASIREMTLLVFRLPGSAPTRLIPPDGPAISAQNPRGSSWRGDPGYDLITVKNPQAGNWRIDAELDPDNRLMVVTDLKLRASGIPAYSTPVDPLQIFAELFNRDEKIRKSSFLRFVDFSLTHVDNQGREKTFPLTHASEREHKGRYAYPYTQRLAEGTHQFVVTADSASFNRSKRFDLEVQWPAEVVIEPADAAGVYDFRLRAREEYLKPDGFVAEVEIEAPDGTREPLPLESIGGWLRARVETNQDGLYQARVRVSGLNHAAEIIDLNLGVFPMLGAYREPPVSVIPPIDEAAAQVEQSEIAGADGDSVDWRLAGIVIVIVNLLLLMLLATGWLVIRSQKTPAELILDDEEISA